MRDRAVEALLGDRQPAVELLGDAADVVVQRAKRRVERGGVRDEVLLLLLAEHRALVGAQAAQLAQQDERRGRAATSARADADQRDDPDRGAELGIHRGKG